MRVSLVIPVRNEEDSLQALIESIGRQTRPPDEVILVDGGSTDKTVALARKLTSDDPRYQVVEVGQATPGRGRNVGIAAASYEWIALTDAGIQLEPAWLERLTDAVTLEPGLDVVYGNYEPIVSTQFERIAALAYVAPKRLRSGARIRGPFIASCLMRLSVWQAVGGFPDLRAAEDLIFMERVQAAGFKIGWAPGATVWWQLQPSLIATFRKFVLYSKHNVWAGRQRDWHYGLVRQYVAGSLFLVLAFTLSIWWLVLLPLGFAVRVAKSIWTRRDGRGLLWFINPWQFFGVGLLLAAIDAATFLGWIQAIWSPRGPGTK